MIIDDKGRLFGKINVIDLFIIGMFILAVCGGIYKFWPKSVLPDTHANVRINFYVYEVPTYTVQNIKVGDIVKDSERNIEFGKVVNVEIGPSDSIAANDKGEFVLSAMPGHSSLKIGVDAKGTIAKDGLKVDNTSYYIGKTVVASAGSSIIVSRISGIEEIR